MTATPRRAIGAGNTSGALAADHAQQERDDDGAHQGEQDHGDGHRIAERGRISRAFIDLASQFIAWAMAPLALGLTLDLMLVSWVISESRGVVVAVGAGAAALFGALWLVFPLARRRRRRREST